jgi:hypothetical protein
MDANANRRTIQEVYLSFLSDSFTGEGGNAFFKNSFRFLILDRKDGFFRILLIVTAKVNFINEFINHKEALIRISIIN